MANSIRQQILDRAETALAAIRKGTTYYTTVKKVYTDILELEGIPKQYLPCLFVLGGEETRSHICIGGGANSMQSVFSVLVGGVVFSGTGNVDTVLEDLILDSNKVILNDATLKGLVMWIEPGNVVRHNDAGPNFAAFDQIYRVTYFYNSSTGG